MSASSKVHLSFSASFHQRHIPSIYSSRLVQVFIVLKVQPSAFKWNRWLYSIVVRLWIVQVRLTSSLGLSLLPNMDDFIKTKKLPLSSAPYSIAPSASTNGLWSSIRSSFLLFIIIFCLSKKRDGIYGWFLKQPLLIAWTRGLSRLAPFLDECCFVFRALFTLYISHFLPHFLLFHHH